MLATPGALPSPAEESDWAFEMKWDGVRAVVYVEDAKVRVLTRNYREVLATYPELGGLGAALGRRHVVLDGEIVTLDPEGRPSFGLLQARMHVQHPSRALLVGTPVHLLVFDLLVDAGRPLLDRPYDERRAALEELRLGLGSDPGSDPVPWAAPPAFQGDGAAAMTLSLGRGLEGVVAKRHSSTYQPGRRSREWVKVKHQRMQEVVVGGWTPGRGRRDGQFGALLVGVPDEHGALGYAGRVGTGFSERSLADLMDRLGRLERPSPAFAEMLPPADARGARWVSPRLVGEVVFAEWTRDGRMRHPSWRGLRPDKEPTDVRRET